MLQLLIHFSFYFCLLYLELKGPVILPPLRQFNLISLDYYIYTYSVF